MNLLITGQTVAQTTVSLAAGQVLGHFGSSHATAGYTVVWLTAAGLSVLGAPMLLIGRANVTTTIAAMGVPVVERKLSESLNGVVLSADAQPMPALMPEQHQFASESRHPIAAIDDKDFIAGAKTIQQHTKSTRRSRRAAEAAAILKQTC
eukprot:SAG31_NODE_688_length_12807_cov_6.395814_8_plen_150_part_00